MGRYRKKPVVIDAIQYTAPIYSNIRDFIESFGSDPKEVLVKVWDERNEGINISNLRGTPHIAVRTLEGDMKISHGDYIIRGVNGEFYACKPDIFAKTYEQEPG